MAMELAQAQMRLRRICIRKAQENEQQHTSGEKEEEEEEPLSPAGRLFNHPSFSCYIIVIVGLRNQIDVDAFKQGLQATLVNHKRFSSVLRPGVGGNLKWAPAKVDIERHVIVPAMTQEEEGVVEDYASKLCRASPMDTSRPLWEIHLLNAKSREAPGGSAVLRIHHSLGDGISLMSLFIACTCKVCDPQSLPTIPRPSSNPAASRRGILAALWTLILMIWYTLLGAANFLATSIWMRDSFTPIRGSAGVEFGPKRVLHATVDLEDIKTVKNAVQGTVNDVLLAMTSAGLVRYLDRRGHNNSKANRRQDLLVRAAVLVNTRSAPGLHELADMMKGGGGCRWGNSLGYLLIRFPMEERDDPLDYARAAMAISRKKKLSLEAAFSYASGKLLLKLAGIKAAAFLTYRVVCNTTFSFSNVMGPVEEVQFFGNPITHIVPTVSGHPHALTIHYQSYMGRMTMVVNVAEDVIRDPEQLCSDCVDALLQMKQRAVATANQKLTKEN